MKSFTVTINNHPESKIYDFDLISDYNRFVYYISVEGETIHMLENDTVENSYVALARYINSLGQITSIVASQNDHSAIEILKTHIRISSSMSATNTLHF